MADDHPIVREGMVALINRQADMHVAGEASNGREAVEQFLALRPDISVLDVRMPVMDGIEAVTCILEKHPGARVVIFTALQGEEDVYRVVRAGARGYVLKSASTKELLDCIRAVAHGNTWIPSVVADRLARRVADEELTRREVDVLNAVARGRTNKEIAATLAIREATVKVHVTRMFAKLKVTTRTEAVNVAVKRGLVHLDSEFAA